MSGSCVKEEKEERTGKSVKPYTWEEKIESLVTLAKAVGRYTDAAEGLISPSTGHDYYKDARRKLFDAYEDFCQWRHDEPYVIDEIKALIG